ncbi:hypothetical protein RN001_014270 [Aquatica leii]|uniref:Uncharacterized protein n=1 Tax=Aquatica leii TaxID=1421715 RepID=A0AAN7Q0L8_9COLE|nr:hypothetical protein RN001_014270 [Aquatica leii]
MHQLDAISQRLENLEHNRSRSRNPQQYPRNSRSRSRPRENNSKYCFYHYRFAEKARRCTTPFGLEYCKLAKSQKIDEELQTLRANNTSMQLKPFRVGDNKVELYYKHYIVRDWPLRENLIPGQKNVAYNILVPKENIYLPPLHIKLGLIKQFVKAVDKTGGAFQFLKTKFPRLSEAKIKEGVFVGPQIRQLFEDSMFIEHLNRKEKRAWLAF